MFVVYSDELFSRISKKNFKETFLIPVHAITRGNHKVIVNEGFDRYFDKVQKIKSLDKGILAHM